VDLKGLRVSLFFTRGVSLQTWETGGMFEREIALYRRLQEHGVRVTFVTYGGKYDLELAKRLPGIRVICNHRNWDENRYIRWVTSSLPWFGRRPQIIKSNQFSGAEIALTAARRIGSKFVVRGGNIPSFQLSHQEGPEAQSTRAALLIEKEVLPIADKIVVATSFMAQMLEERYAIPSSKIVIIPNYVMTDLFTPALKNYPAPGKRLCFIGRLEKQKNLPALLGALIGLNVELDIVGNGSMRESLESFAAANNLRVNFLGNIPNLALPEVIRAADIYIQPSLYEGHPKTIIEAMSCGAAVIAGDSPGICDLISHRQNGFLCSTTPEGIRSAVLEVLSDSELRHRMGESARQYAVDNFSLDRIVEMELKLYQELISNNEEQK
jgi:glycosyltransferase involved in cell wall biosynthesis